MHDSSSNLNFSSLDSLFIDFSWDSNLENKLNQAEILNDEAKPPLSESQTEERSND